MPERCVSVFLFFSPVSLLYLFVEVTGKKPFCYFLLFLSSFWKIEMVRRLIYVPALWLLHWPTINKLLLRYLTLNLDIWGVTHHFTSVWHRLCTNVWKNFHILPKIMNIYKIIFFPQKHLFCKSPKFVPTSEDTETLYTIRGITSIFRASPDVH